MLEQAVTFLRRMVGFQPEDADVERRARARYPVNLDITCRPASGTENQHLTARVRNVSLGGIRLVVNRRFDPGDLLSVELPGPNGGPPHNVLACVVHVTPEANGEWALGCNFACELTDDDLAAFGAERKRPAPPDKRAWQRFECNVTALCQVIAEPEQPTWIARVLNISASGVGLLASEQVPMGAMLSVRLQGSHGAPPCNVLACVVHSGAEGERWAIGCNFIRELKEEELKVLL